MSTSASSVWNFFKKIDIKTVSCNLCGKTYKSSGNTTNLTTHLKNKHHFAYVKCAKVKSTVKVRTDTRKTNTPIGICDDSPCSPSPAQPSTSAAFENEQTDDDRQSHMSSSSLEDTYFHSPPVTPSISRLRQQTLADLFEMSSSFEEGGQKHAGITQTLIYMICKDNMPFSCVEKDGMKKFCQAMCPRFKLPSKFKVTQLIEQKYVSVKAVVQNVLKEANYISLTSDILTLTNSTRSFIVMTAHFLRDGNLESFSFSALRLFEAHTAQYISEKFEEITIKFSVEKNKILSITTDGGANMVAAVKLFLGDGKRIPCMAHLMNLVVDGALKDITSFSKIADHIKSIVLYFKQSVSAMDELRKDQERSGKKEGEVLTLLQSVSTRWNSCLDMLERFLLLSGIVVKILASKSAVKKKVPDMVPTSHLNVIRDMVHLLRPFKEATEEISGEKYVTASLAIPLASLLKHELEVADPVTEIGLLLKQSLLTGVMERLVPLEKNPFLAKATILDPRFKKIHFSSPIAVSTVILEISEEIRSEHRRRGRISPEQEISEEEGVAGGSGLAKTTMSIWSRHEKILRQVATQEIPRVGSLPNELKQYLDQPNIERTKDPIQYWAHCRHFTPVIAEISWKYLACPASSVSSERVASVVNLTVPNNRSRITGEHIEQRVFLSTISNKYWNM